MKNSLSQLRLFFSGYVQGVGFRSFIAKTVRNHPNVCGFTRNLDDGRVETVLEGEKEILNKIFEQIEKGCPGSTVENIKTLWGKKEQREFFQFTVY